MTAVLSISSVDKKLSTFTSNLEIVGLEPRNGGEKMNKKAIILMSLMIFTVTAFPCLSTVQAKITEVNDLEGYTEYYGTMGGANFYILIPDDWTNPLGDGMLVVMCRSAGYIEDPRDSVLDYPFAVGLAMSGIAVAASNYGPSDNVKDGVIRTHQLTMYVTDNYDVTGKVFLFGTSLGGCTALLLGESHPDVYSGVLDNSGIKDWAAMYYDAVDYMADHAGEDDFLDVYYGGAIIQGFPSTYGGTPDRKPNKYAKYSPTHHADMSIPVISVVHVDDAIVDPTQTALYHAALGDPSLHIIVEVTESTPGVPPITLPGFPPFSSWYGHFDPETFMAAAANLFVLIAWSNTFAP
jgi:pimeloyl-ACP methyl ester carboxylesterase